MHILFLTDNFPPEVNAPASRTFEHCREWVRLGETVTVITCAPNFPKGKVFSGYRNALWTTEHMDGIRVIRVWTYITANEGFLRRTLDYMSFMVSAIIASLWVKKVDVVIGTSPQFFTVCAAYITGLLKHSPWVFELRDIWPASIKAVGSMQEGFLYRQLEKLELFLYRKANHIVALTQAFKRELIARGVDPNKISVITNGVNLKLFSPQKKDLRLVSRLGLEGKFVAGYIGTVGMAHGLETLIEAAAVIQNHPHGQDIRILILGDGARKRALQQLAIQKKLENLLFVDTVEKKEVPTYWALLDVAIIHLKEDPLFEKVIPSKLFEAMAMGVPILHAVRGESTNMVNQYRVGKTIEPDNSNALASEIQWFSSNPEQLLQMKNSSLTAAIQYDRTVLAKAMLAILSRTALSGA